MAEPQAKKARVEEAPEEQEKNAKAPGKTCHTDPVVFHVHDLTMNVPAPNPSYNLLKSLGESGVASLLAGARASVGMKAGRYMFEVRAVELSSDRRGSQGGLVRIGVSTSSSSLLMGEDSESICFDSDGVLLHNKKRTPAARIVAGGVYAVVVNLEKGSPNCNTISLFKDGIRVCQPQPLPEELKGKTLFPAVTFRAATVHMNFGPDPAKPLPFTCRMLVGAEKADVVCTPAPEASKKFEVVYPVGLPAEGAFDWCDMFLKRNPSYTEISDRALVAWAVASGLPKKGGSSIDTPGTWDELGLARRALLRLAPLQQRNFVVMELKGNLTAGDRAVNLAHFPSASFTKRAYVCVGEPTADFVKYSQELILKDKQLKSDNVFRAKKAEEKRQKMIAQRQKAAEKAKKKAAKKAAAELAKKKAALQKAKEAAEKKDGDKKEEEEPEKEAEEEEEESEKEDEEMPEQEEAPPKVTLDGDELALKFHATDTPDVTAKVFSSCFMNFTLPEKSEGFDDVKFSWSKAPAAEAYLKQWILNRKLTTRIEDITPSKDFNAKLNQFKQEIKVLSDKQKSYKAAVTKKENDKRVKAARKVAAAKAAALKKEKKEAAAKAAAEKGEEPPKDEEEEAQKEEEEEEEEEEVDFDGLDIFGVDDLSDVGGGMPLTRDFLGEDWAMLNLRFELYLMIVSFRADAADPERTGIYLNHLDFYYQKYLKKALVFRDYGVGSLEELVKLIPDTVYLTKEKVLQTTLPDELEKYFVLVMLTEEARRHRSLVLDAGEESARLKLAGHLVNSQGGAQGAGGGGGGKWGNKGGNWKSTPYGKW